MLTGTPMNIFLLNHCSGGAILQRKPRCVNHVALLVFNEFIYLDLIPVRVEQNGGERRFGSFNSHGPRLIRRQTRRTTLSRGRHEVRQPFRSVLFERPGLEGQKITEPTPSRGVEGKVLKMPRWGWSGEGCRENFDDHFTQAFPRVSKCL